MAYIRNIHIEQIIMALLLCLSGNVFAQQEQRSSLPEEIVITGKASMMELRIQVEAAERNAYEIFNQFNDEGRFNIHCRMRAPLGTRIKQQECTPRFVLDAVEGEAQDFLSRVTGSGFTFSSPPAQSVIASQRREYQDKMREIADEHPQFLEAITEYAELKAQYDAATSMASE